MKSTITPDAARFIDWAMEQLDDPETYNQLLKEIRDNFQRFYEQSPQTITEQLHAKLDRGALEHGEPYYPVEKIREELTNEYLDLLGWLLIEKWNQRRNQP